MLNFRLEGTSGRCLKILCLGAHSDDIEIGCGGTILRLLSEHPRVEVHWVVLGSSGKRGVEARASAKKFLKGAERRTIIVKRFQDGFFPYHGGEIKRYFEVMKKKVDPDVIFTHFRHDLHQDHRLVSELTWNTFRDHLIFEYEIVKYDGDLGNPNTFVRLEEQVCKEKVDTILGTFKTQAGQHWFSEEAFNGLHKLRGIESNAPEGYAEGFHVRKVVV